MNRHLKKAWMILTYECVSFLVDSTDHFNQVFGSERVPVIVLRLAGFCNGRAGSVGYILVSRCRIESENSQAGLLIQRGNVDKTRLLPFFSQINKMTVKRHDTFQHRSRIQGAHEKHLFFNGDVNCLWSGCACSWTFFQSLIMMAWL